MNNFSIKVLGSSSNGNSYIVTAGPEALLIECGIPFPKILKGLNFKTTNVKGCLISHKHNDHAHAFREVEKRGIPIVCTSETITKYKPLTLYNIFIAGKDTIKLGGFKIMPFDCNHKNGDGSPCECKGYLIHHKEIGTLLFATDTYFLKQQFNNVDHILIECNYSQEYLNETYKDRRSIKSHMSIEILKETLKAWDLRKTKDITLIHLSDTNSRGEKFRQEIEEITGIKTYVAKKGLIIGGQDEYRRI